MSRTRLVLVLVLLLVVVAIGRQAVTAFAQLRSDTVPAALAPSPNSAKLSAAAEAAARRLLDSPALGPEQRDKNTSIQGNTGEQGTSAAQPVAPPAQPSQPPTADPQAPAALTATVTTETLNVRGGPGTQYQIVGQVHRGDTLTLLSEPGRWPQIRTETGLVGFVSATYIDLNGPSLQAPAPPSRQTSPSASGQGGPLAPPAGGPNAPAPRRSLGDTAGGQMATDEAGNTARVYNRTDGAYQFDADQLLKLLRDEGLDGQRVNVSLVDSQYGNRSSTSWGEITVDCHPIQVPIEPSRPAPPGNGKTGAAFCNAVALHEVYHLITLARAGWGGAEGDADEFASARLRQYILVR